MDGESRIARQGDCGFSATIEAGHYGLLFWFVDLSVRRFKTVRAKAGAGLLSEVGERSTTEL
jgi:hypothetical protein